MIANSFIVKNDVFGNRFLNDKKISRDRGTTPRNHMVGNRSNRSLSKFDVVTPKVRWQQTFIDKALKSFGEMETMGKMKVLEVMEIVEKYLPLRRKRCCLWSSRIQMMSLIRIN